MIEIQRHIEALLLDNECVIVPDFGGFVTHYVHAHYDENDNSFVPPLRTLGFNPQLRINDSLLVQSYVTAYDISYPEALRRIEAEVEEMKQVLSSEGSYTLDDIGTLTINSDGNYQFEPCEAGILSPELYGLGNIMFARLKDIRIEKTDIPRQDSPEKEEKTDSSAPANTLSLLEFTETDDDTDRAIEIKLSWIRNAIAVAAAVVAFFFMATPIANSDFGTQTMSNLQGNVLYRLMPKDTNMTPTTPVLKSESAPVTQTDSIHHAEQVAQTIQEETTIKSSTATTRYCIVLASQVKKSNAEYYVQKLHERGINDAEVYISNNTVRVICGSFETEGAAYNRLNELNKCEEFADAWVYKKVNS